MSENESELFNVGYVKQAHGLKGELYLRLFTPSPAWLKHFKHVYLQRPNEDLSQPFIVTRHRPFKDGLILETEEITSRTMAEAFKGSKAFIPREWLISEPGENVFLQELLEFEVYDGENRLGKVVGFSSNGAQDILLVKDEAKDFRYQIPLVEAWVVRLDPSSQQLVMTLPAGLLEFHEK